MGILVYTPELEEKIRTRQLLPRDSEEEVEIRAHMLYATALLTEDVNALRPPELQVIIPQVDARLWLQLPHDALAAPPDAHHHVLT